MSSHGAKQHAETRACNSSHRIPGAGDKPERRWTWKRCYRNDIDDIVVDRLVAGEHVNGTRYERMEAVRRLHRQGMNIAAIARHLKMQSRQVYRDLYYLNLIQEGALHLSHRQAADRRRAIAVLVPAGVRRRELQTLFGVCETTISTDMRLLGLTGTGPNRKPIRSRSELLATYGHLLTADARTVGVA